MTATGPDPQAPAAPLVVVNPMASRLVEARRREQLLGVVADACAEKTGRGPEILVATSAEEMRRAVEAALAPARPLIAVVGGDGTVRDVAVVVAGHDVPLAIVPAGTANIFAATVGIPRGAERAARAIADGRPRHVDLGLARWGTADGGAHEERVFVVAAGMGFDALLMASTAPGSKRRLGRYAYFLAGARMLGRVSGAPVRLTVDGEVVETRAIQVLVANGGELIPGLLRPALPIDPDDGLLDVIVVEGHGLLDGVRGGLEAILRRGIGSSSSGRSRRLRGGTVRVEGPPDEPIEVDGDVVGVGWVEAVCRPRAIRVLVPRRADTASGSRSEAPT